MRKIIAAILILAIALCGMAASAETDESVTLIADGETRDFDGDGTEETLRFIPAEPDEYDEINSFTIGIGDQVYAVDDAWCLSGNIYAVNYGIGKYYAPERQWGTMFMVSEYGPSDDPLTYCYLYTNGRLYDAGTIPALPENMAVGDRCKITTTVRASHIGTWSREADYVLAEACWWDEELQENFEEYRMCQSPRGEYSMGMIVMLNRDLPLYGSRYDAEPTVMMAGDQKVILAACDDVCWLYITDMDGRNGGWIRICEGDSEDCVIVDGENVKVSDAFEGVIYAD